MNVVARLYTLGTFRELLHTELEYHRFLNPKTGRCSEVPMGGMLTLSFMAGHNNDRLQRWILHSPKGKRCTLTESKVVFYKGSFDGVVLFEYHFNDSALVMWHESFCTHGEKPMTITLKISSAIHKIKGVTHIKPWQESWVKPKEQQPYTSAENQQKTEPIKVINISGPFDETGNKVKYISPKHTYYYHATIKNYKEGDDLNQIQWSATYDDEDTAQHQKLLTGGIYQDGILKIQIQVSKGKHTATIYAHTGNLNPNINTKAKYKQVVTFFIGGAGDKEPFYGIGPTNNILGVKNKFDNNISFIQYSSKHLGYNEVKGEEDIKNNVLNLIPNKDGTQINIVGHSLGGWNGAHLSQILTDMGYMVEVLITLDPVGAGEHIKIISDIHIRTPKPKMNYWINIYTHPENYITDDAVADAGRQWTPDPKDIHVLHITKYSHGESRNMFNEILVKKTISASSLLQNSISNYIETP